MNRFDTPPKQRPRRARFSSTALSSTRSAFHDTRDVRLPSRSVTSLPRAPVGPTIERHAGSDDTEFASNQHQGLSVDDDEFVWECQQLVRDGTFDLVFYYEAIADQDGISKGRERSHAVTGVEGV